MLTRELLLTIAQETGFIAMLLTIGTIAIVTTIFRLVEYLYPSKKGAKAMVKITHIFTCDGVTNEGGVCKMTHAFNYDYNLRQRTPSPALIPDVPWGWTMVDNTLLCPLHKIVISPRNRDAIE